MCFMRTKKKPETETKPVEKLREEPREIPSESEDGLERKSFAFFVDSKNNVQWDRMREKTKEELRAFLKRPDIAKALGVEAPAEMIELMSVEWCANLYDTIGTIEAAMASKWKGVPKEIAEQAFAYSAFEKSQLGPPTARVINKYATDWKVRFKDEMALAFLLITITMAKIQLCNALMIQQRPVPVPATPIDGKKEEVVQ